MNDIHTGDRYATKEGGTYVTVIEIDLDGRVRVEFDGSGAKRWADRETFLRRYPLHVS